MTTDNTVDSFRPRNFPFSDPDPDPDLDPDPDPDLDLDLDLVLVKMLCVLVMIVFTAIVSGFKHGGNFALKTLHELAFLGKSSLMVVNDE